MNQKGFTLMEILIVVGVIIAIGVLAAFAVNSARSKQRDATRISQVRQVQAALENHFNQVNAYPDGENLPLGDAGQSRCLGTGGFQQDCGADDFVFLQVVTQTLDSGLDGASICGTPGRNAYCYSALEGAGDYRIVFELENNWPEVGLIQGLNCATPNGVEGGRCP